MRVSFVILHYLTSKDTINCIQSILSNINYNLLDIVVVDNGSPNRSIEEVESIFSDINIVHFLKSRENLGFARGNNLGYSFAKKKLNSDFIILINNDTILEQGDFISKVISKYESDKFHILGPDIISLADGGHQNPLKSVSHNIIEVKKRIYKMKILSFINKIRVYDILLKVRDLLGRENKTKNFEECHSTNEKKNIPLHGCCIIFSPDYVRNYKGLYSNTYMYVEEDILYHISQKENMKLIYYPEIKIFHKEDSSTNALLNKKRIKREFIFKHSIDSLTELIKIIKDEKRYKKDLIE